MSVAAATAPRLAHQRAGGRFQITEVCAGPETRGALEELGFVAGADVSVARQCRGDVIVRLGASRVALAREHAASIVVKPL
jgi:Fe2+ transport system protein FeoA